MAEPDAGPAQGKPAAAAAAEAAAKAPKGNPVFRMMGLPTFRARLPSRNWSIFLTIVGTWTAAVVYDRREKKKVQRKWANLVAHLADERLDTKTLPRRLTVFVEAPPQDGLTTARDHFHEYVKPVLVAAALDWDAVEGRKEGDIRAGLAERIRKLRKLQGERSAEPLEDDSEAALLLLREVQGIKPSDAVAGDIVVGRQAWKEYVRGLHEGWLGPLDPPSSPEDNLHATDTVSTSSAPPAPEEQPKTAEQEQPRPSDSETAFAAPETGAPPTDTPKPEEKPAKEEAEKPKKKKQPPPFNTPSDYPSALLPPSIPTEFAPSIAIPHPHILGFLNTPTRMYRFLNRRKLADDIGRQTAAAVFAAYRPYYSAAEGGLATDSDSDSNTSQSEQEILLKHEEKEWHKSARDRSKDEAGKERPWLDDIVLDPRIADRMRKFELDAEQEAKAKEIAAGAEPWWKEVWASWTAKGDKDGAE